MIDRDSNDRRHDPEQLTPAQFGAELDYLTDVYHNPGLLPASTVISGRFGEAWQMELPEIQGTKIEAQLRLARDITSEVIPTTSTMQELYFKVGSSRGANSALIAALQPGIRQTIDGLYSTVEQSVYLSTASQIPPTLLYLVLSQLELSNPAEVENLHSIPPTDYAMRDFCLNITEDKPIKTDDRLLRTLYKTLHQTYKLTDSRDFAIDIIRRLAPYYFIDQTATEISDEEVATAVMRLMSECEAYGSPLAFNMTAKSQKGISDVVKRELDHIRARSRGGILEPDQPAVYKAFAALTMTKLTRHLVDGIANNKLHLYTVLSTAYAETVQDSPFLAELAATEVMVDGKEDWVQIGRVASGRSGDKAPSEAASSDEAESEELRLIIEKYPHIDFSRLLWLKSIRDSWQTPGAKLVRRPLNGREIRAVEEQGTTEEAQYRGYYVVLLPVILSDGKVVYNAIGDSLVKRRHVLFGWKWQKGFDGNGRQFAGPEQVFSDDKEKAKLFGAKRFLHTANVRERALSYLQEEMELADPSDELLTVAMGMLAIHSAQQIDADADRG